jgi:hypothetical protein
MSSLSKEDPTDGFSKKSPPTQFVVGPSNVEKKQKVWAKPKSVGLSSLLKDVRPSHRSKQPTPCK